MISTGRLLAATALLTVFSSPAYAQDAAGGDSGGIPDIVVTAQKRAENVQDVPIAISAFTAEALSERAVTSGIAVQHLTQCHAGCRHAVLWLIGGALSLYSRHWRQRFCVQH
jgi:hypothetical protein